jgi:hypothetical protein
MRGFKTTEIKIEVMSEFQELYLHDFNTPMLKKISSSSAISYFYARLPPASDPSTPIALRNIHVSRDIVNFLQGTLPFIYDSYLIFILRFTPYWLHMNN